MCAASQACAAELRSLLRVPAHRYCVLDDPTALPDAEVDKLYQALQALKAAHAALLTPDSTTQRVSGPVLAGLVAVRHAVPMLIIRTVCNPPAVHLKVG